MRPLHSPLTLYAPSLYHPEFCNASITTSILKAQKVPSHMGRYLNVCTLGPTSRPHIYIRFSCDFSINSLCSPHLRTDNDCNSYHIPIHLEAGESAYIIPADNPPGSDSIISSGLTKKLICLVKNKM